MHFGAHCCNSVQVAAMLVYCTLAQIGADWSNMVQIGELGAVWSNLVEFAAHWCNLVQFSAV